MLASRRRRFAGWTFNTALQLVVLIGVIACYIHDAELAFDITMRMRLIGIEPFSFFVKLQLLVWWAVGMLTAVQSVLLARTGQSFGDRLLGMRVVAVDGRHDRVRLRVALRVVPLTALSLVPSVLAWCDIILPYMALVLFAISVAILFDVAFAARKDRRCLHDLISGTMVVMVAGGEEDNHPHTPAS